MRPSPPDRFLPTLVAIALGLGVAASVTTTALAAFASTTAPATATLATANLAAPTGLTASCVPLSSNVTLSWTATTSAAATGYIVLRGTTSGGPYSQIGTVNGRATTTFTTTISVLQTFYYVVQASRANWTSPSSNQAGVLSTGVGVCQSV
jgi:hypothetical protein